MQNVRSRRYSVPNEPPEQGGDPDKTPTPRELLTREQAWRWAWRKLRLLDLALEERIKAWARRP